LLGSKTKKMKIIVAESIQLKNSISISVELEEGKAASPAEEVGKAE